MSEARSLPHAMEAERSVLGGVVMYGQAYAEAALEVSPTDFYHPAHGAIFEAVGHVVDAGKPVDFLTVAEQMKADDTAHKLRALGGDGYFTELTGAVVTVENIRYHARMVRQKARVRRLILAAQEVAAAGFGDPSDVDEYLERSSASIVEVTAAGSGAAEPKSWADVLRASLRGIEQRASGREDSPAMSTGYRELDQVIRGGLRAGKQYVVAARPGMGKSAFAMEVCVNVGRLGFPALVVSCEMAAEELGERALSAESGVDLGWEALERLGAAEFLRLNNAGVSQHALPIRVVDDPNITLGRLRMQARRWRLRQEAAWRSRPGVLICDYLQLLEADQRRGKGETREAEVSGFSRALKLLARELGVATVVLSQLNRDLEKRPDKRPLLSDLRESGAIEQDADVVLMLYRDELYHAKTAQKGICEVIVRKQRGGATNVCVPLRFEPEFTRFSDAPEDQVQTSLPMPPAPPPEELED